MLIAEELILLALDDAGRMPPKVRTSRAAAVVVGGALLAELALDGAVASDKHLMRQTMLRAVPDRRPSSSQPLRDAFDRVAEESGAPLPLALSIGAGRFEQLAAGLVSQGHLARKEHASFLAVPVTWPVADRERKDTLQLRVMSELVRDSAPEPRTGVLIAFLSVLNVVDQLPTPANGSPTALRRRAKAIARGSWASAAVRTALRSVDSGRGNPPRGESPTQGFNGEGDAGW
ncbi:GPP34 family phosphoprotein [Nocardioides sp. NPDC000445]|uniref:GOLPH3/VPS74 family protein n=1 Tax=Nocardioides sp. NPDC000445 TaxID=3154257 RepID=UPI00331844F7